MTNFKQFNVRLTKMLLINVQKCIAKNHMTQIVVQAHSKMNCRNFMLLVENILEVWKYLIPDVSASQKNII